MDTPGTESVFIGRKEKELSRERREGEKEKVRRTDLFQNASRGWFESSQDKDFPSLPNLGFSDPIRATPMK